MKRLPQQLRIGEHEVHLSATPLGGGRYEVRAGSEKLVVDAGAISGGGFWFTAADGVRHFAYAALCGDDLQIRVDGRTWLLPSAERERERDAAANDPSRVVAPMTGTVTRVLCAAGDRIAKDQDLVVITAMKMEHRLAALADGTVVEVPGVEGQTVEAGALLVRIEPAA